MNRSNSRSDITKSKTPRSRAGLLLAQINSVASASRINSITMQAINEDARALVTADSPGAHSILGASAALYGRDEEVRVHYRIALEHAGRSAVPYLNYSIALLQVGDSVKAYRMALEAAKRAPDSDAVLPHLIMSAFESGHFRESLAHCERWRTSHPENEPVALWSGADHHRRDRARHAVRGSHREGVASGQSGARRRKCSTGGDRTLPGHAPTRRVPVPDRRTCDAPAERRALGATVAARIAEAATGAGAPENTLQIIFVAAE